MFLYITVLLLNPTREEGSTASLLILRRNQREYCIFSSGIFLSSLSIFSLLPSSLFSPLSPLPSPLSPLPSPLFLMYSDLKFYIYFWGLMTISSVAYSEIDNLLIVSLANSLLDHRTTHRFNPHSFAKKYHLII